MTRQAHGLACEGLRHSGELEHHAARLDDGDPAFGVTLAGTHAGLGRLLGVRLVREDVDPDLAAALDLAGHRDTSGLDLPVRDPAALERLDPVLAELDLALTLGQAAPATAVHLAELGSAGQQHQASAPGLVVSVAGASGAGVDGACVSGAGVAGAGVAGACVAGA